jgi:uncharacterized membrane protein YdjX (TVP38/TMEM64 family)
MFHPPLAPRALLLGFLLFGFAAERCPVLVHAFSKPVPRIASRSSYLFASVGGDDDDKIGRWIFRPPIRDSPVNPTVTTDESPKKRGVDFSRISTLTKPGIKQVVDNKTAKKGRTSLRSANRLPASPLEEIEDSPSTPLFDATNPQTIFGLAAAAGLASVVCISYSLGLTMDDFVRGAQTLVTNPSGFSQELIEGVKSLGPTGVVYYALIYMIAEILAVPATPLTLSAGYLFGLQNGILTVLVGATGAACVGFWISRTFLRDYVESTLLAPAPDGSSPNTLAKLDKAIGKEGFKLLVLIRLSPIFPFSVTNYLYGASSIDFGSYLFGTLIGFIPTTTAYVYTGMVGQALTAGSGGEQPWYVYAGGFAVLAVLVKLVTDVATGIIETIEED